jgi:peroxiredoxin (alkyl hydroperoxide reductase subunit C)
MALSVSLLACLIVSGRAMLPSSSSAQTASESPATPVKVGDMAPDFTLSNQDGKPVTLSSFRGKSEVVLAFYVFAFTGACENELRSYQSKLSVLEAAGAQVLGVSMDSPYANKAFAAQIGVTFPLLSDRDKEVITQYGVYNSKDNTARRATFLIDTSGHVKMMQFDKEAIDPSAVVSTCTRE